MILWKELFLARPYLLFVHTYSMKSYIHKTSHSGVHLVCIVQFSKVTRRLATRLSYQSIATLSRKLFEDFQSSFASTTERIYSIRPLPLRQYEF